MVITMYYFSYLNEDLAEQAYQGIIRKIAHLLPPLLHPPPVVSWPWLYMCASISYELF